jgi:hypothetical protein
LPEAISDTNGLSNAWSHVAGLAAIVGVVVVAVSGGGIKPMSRRWDAAASRYDQEKPRIAEAARNGPSVKDQGPRPWHHPTEGVRT